MRIEHFAINVRDLERTRDFFVKYFGATTNEGYHNPRTGLRSYFLSFLGIVGFEGHGKEKRLNRILHFAIPLILYSIYLNRRDKF